MNYVQLQHACTCISQPNILSCSLNGVFNFKRVSCCSLQKLGVVVAVCCMAADAVCVLLIHLLNGRTSLLVLSCLFTAISELNWDVLDVVTVEIFPTTLRLASQNSHSISKSHLRHLPNVMRNNLGRAKAQISFRI
jgi:hypothetical protein